MSLTQIELASEKQALLLFGGDENAVIWQLVATLTMPPNWKVNTQGACWQKYCSF
jgi:hypothetical protein